MKKTLVLLLFALSLLFYTISGYASSDYTFVWNNSTVSLDNTTPETSGDGEHSSVFFVYSFGNGSITLKQTKGTCHELSYTKLFSGFLGTAHEWGKFEITVVPQSGKKNVTQWDDTFFNGECEINLDKAGNYYIYIRPYSNQEITNSYFLDRFSGWEEPPTWHLSEFQNCNVLNKSPYSIAETTPPPAESAPSKPAPPTENVPSEPESPVLPVSASVDVYYRLEDGSILRSETKLFSQGTHYLYNEYPLEDTYEVVGTSCFTINVSSNGVANPQTVSFILKNKAVNNGYYAQKAWPVGSYCVMFDDGNNIRSGPGTGYSIIGQANTGECFLILETAIGSTGKDWYAIDYYGQVGWLSSGIVSVDGHRDGTVNGIPIYD